MTLSNIATLIHLILQKHNLTIPGLIDTLFGSNMLFVVSPVSKVISILGSIIIRLSFDYKVRDSSTKYKIALLFNYIMLQ